MVTETHSETRGEPLRRGKRALSHFLGGASVVDGKRMHCGLLEEPDMDSTGQSSYSALLCLDVLREPAEMLCELLLMLFRRSQTFNAVRNCLEARPMIFLTVLSLVSFEFEFPTLFMNDCFWSRTFIRSAVML